MEKEKKDKEIDLLTREREEGIKRLLEMLSSDNIKDMIEQSKSYLVFITTLKGDHVRGFTSMGGNFNDLTILSIQSIKKVVNSLEVVEKSTDKDLEKIRKDKLK